MSVYLCVCTANLFLQSVTTASAKPPCTTVFWHKLTDNFNKNECLLSVLNNSFNKIIELHTIIYITVDV